MVSTTSNLHICLWNGERRGHRQTGSMAFCGWLAALAGDGQGAHADLDQALASSRQADLSWNSSYPLVILARLSLAEGAWNAATAQAQDALALSEESDDLQAQRLASGVMAKLEILEGHPGERRAALRGRSQRG